MTEATVSRMQSRREVVGLPAGRAPPDGYPLDSHSGLGLTVFSHALILVVVGMFSANVLSGQVDHALGYRHDDMGPASTASSREFEPLRQITGGTRSILYYGARCDAGLTRGWVMMAAGLAAAALFGFGVLGWYDRKGLHRIPAKTTRDKTAVPA
ncbi:hypothetical protein AB0D14_41065 [Streptomyces sp. NPDC048484]|uniref:hypothetical protein n=1 Tax=Streptomyces sp. NPDC048484 TaxID=3155146 RepID=UPI0034388273